MTSEHLGESLGTDFFSVREQFTDEQWSHFITVRRFVNEEVVPVIGPYWERAEIPWPLVRRLPELGIVGEDIRGYGCAGMSPMACGLVTMELHRGDGSLGVFLGVHAGLAMQSIAMLTCWRHEDGPFPRTTGTTVVPPYQRPGDRLDTGDRRPPGSPAAE